MACQASWVLASASEARRWMAVITLCNWDCSSGLSIRRMGGLCGLKGALNASYLNAALSVTSLVQPQILYEARFRCDALDGNSEQARDHVPELHSRRVAHKEGEQAFQQFQCSQHVRQKWKHQSASQPPKPIRITVPAINAAISSNALSIPFNKFNNDPL
jgi:hypothetical protein